MIALVNYGMGNIRSVEKALQFLGCEVKVTDKPDEVLEADKIVLPGVGAFADCMKGLAEKKLDYAIKEGIKQNKPYFGICLGLQILFEKSFEGGSNKGLSILKGSVRKLPNTVKVPHMGWNAVNIIRFSPLYKRIKEPFYAYFVHSYYVDSSEEETVIATVNHGLTFCCAVAKGRVFGVQFHPEKSGAMGLQMLKNFAELAV